MRILHWSMMPSRWIQHDAGLRRFTAGRGLGTTLGALKLYLTIVVNVPPTGRNRGQLTASYDELARSAGIARGLVSACLAKLRDETLINVSIGKGTRRSTYLVTKFGEDGWAMVPTQYLVQKGLIRVFNPRFSTDLYAVKLYMLLVTFRDTGTRETHISYESIQDYTAMNRTSISKAMGVLIDRELVSVLSGQSGYSSVPYNRYIIRGLPPPKNE